MPVSAARAAAFDILLRIERESSFASDLLHSRAYRGLSAEDQNLTTELVMGVLRWRSWLDAHIARNASQPLAKLDLEVLLALRLGTYQFVWLDRIPKRAALHESVELVKRARKRSATGFVNAILRKLSAAPVAKPMQTAGGSAQDLADAYAHPLWLVERWIAHYGREITEKICAHDQKVPTTAIRLRTRDAQKASESEGIAVSPGDLLSSARVVASGDVTKTKGFRVRDIVIQDEASQLVAALVGHGSPILDCCAAPGGKTLAIADRNKDAALVAAEIHPHRARLLRKLVGDAAQIHVVTADARHLPTAKQFERVLADVPCSGTGTLARNPEIKWRLAQQDLSDLHDRQVAILRAALARLARGGRLIYSTCSLEPEENERVVDTVLREHPDFQVVDCLSELDKLKTSGELIWPDPAFLVRGPYLRTFPGVHPCDGFFAAIVERK